MASIIRQARGYGGAIPLNGGIVLDLTLLNNVREIDGDILTFTAEGGSGVGAFAYGHFEQSLEGLEVVTPEGDLLWVEGENLCLFYAAEGITASIYFFKA